MNIDFTHHPGFSAYVLLLMFAGAVMLFLASVRSTRVGVRVFNGVFGAGYVGYGFYLAFLFHGGSYILFFKAFILPVVMIIRTLKGRPATGVAPRRPARPAQIPDQWTPPAQQQMPAHWPGVTSPAAQQQPPAAP